MKYNLKEDKRWKTFLEFKKNGEQESLIENYLVFKILYSVKYVKIDHRKKIMSQNVSKTSRKRHLNEYSEW